VLSHTKALPVSDLLPPANCEFERAGKAA